MQKKITARLMVSDGGNYVPLDRLPEERKKRIIAELTDRALRAAGYAPEPGPGAAAEKRQMSNDNLLKKKG